MPTAHYILLSALVDNGLHPSNPNRTTETAPRLDVNVPRSNPHLASNNIIGNDPRTMNVTTNGLSLPAIRSNSNLTVNNDQQDKKKYTSFQDRVDALREYKEKTGHLIVSRKIDESLFNWCMHIRSSRNKPGEGKLKLTADRIAALDAIGFDWRSETTALSASRPKWNFQDHVNNLRAYKTQHGHPNVKQTEDKNLYRWCTNIRNAQRNPETCRMKLTADRIAALDAIGFDWRSEGISRNSQKHISFQDRVKALSEYKEINGHLNVKRTEDKNLYHWCSKIRNARNKPGEGKLKLTADRISALDAIGFNWRTEIAPRNCEKIIDHIEAFAALDAIGFDWRLSKSVLQPFDSLGNDADKASGKSEENNNTVQNCEDGRQHDDLERVGISDALFTSQEINHDGLTEEEKIMFAIERSISAAEE